MIDIMLSSGLDRREREIVRNRFGLNESRTPMTLDEVGKHYGLTRERIRQIESKALRKLRGPKFRVLFKDYCRDNPKKDKEYPFLDAQNSKSDAVNPGVVIPFERIDELAGKASLKGGIAHA